MSQAKMDRVFRQFTASAAGGSALGLAIVYRLASSSGGSARLTRTEGGAWPLQWIFLAPRPPGLRCPVGWSAWLAEDAASLSAQDQPLGVAPGQGDCEAEHADVAQGQVGKPARDSQRYYDLE